MVLSTIDLQDWIGKNSIGAEVPWSRLEMILPEGCKPEARVLDDCVFRFREILSDSQSETIRLRELFRATLSDPKLSDLSEASDDLIVDRMYLFGLFAENLLDRIELLDHHIPELTEWRERGYSWNGDAEKLLSELRDLRSIYGAIEKILRGWSQQLCEEYLRRHPDAGRLPFQPLDLGPTNSARLPPVL